MRTSTPRSRRPKPRQEEQAPMECNEWVTERGVCGCFCQKFALSFEGAWTVGLKKSSAICQILHG